MARRSWLMYLVVGTAVLAAFLVVPGLRLGPLFNLIGLSGAVVIVTVMRKHGPGDRWPWLLVAIGQVLFVAGDVITYNYARFFGTDPPFPSIGDLFYLSVYPFLIAGILLLVRHRSPGRDRASLIDSLIVGVGVGAISWVFLISPYVDDSTLTLREKLVAMAYPLMDLILVTVAVRLAVGARRRSTAFHLMMASIAVLFVTDSIYGWIVLHGGYDNTTGYLEGGWGLFYILWGAAALHPSAHVFDEPVEENEPKQPRRRLLILAAAALLAPSINFVVSIRVQTKVTAAAAIITFALVLIRLNGLMVDITEYRRTARALREAEVKYRSLVEGLPAVVYIAEFGEDGDFTYISPQVESILGFTQEEFAVASVWRQRIVPDDRALAIGAELGVLRGEGRLQCEYRIVDKDDNLVWIREEADAVYDENGKPIFLQGVMYDITDQKNIEEQLVKALEAEQETNRIRSEFVLMINHELRTPLTTVVTGAELLANESLAETDRQELVEDMIRDGHRLDGLISEMLTVAQIENSGLSYTLRRTTVGTVLERLRRDGASGNLTIGGDLLAEEVVHTDPQPLIQLLLSLADNAFTHGATRVELDVARSLPFTPMQTVGAELTSGLYFLVQDNGPGIDPEFLPRAFDKFEKQSRSSGTGLGLYLARLMVEAIEGSILVCTGPEGTVIAVAIPLVSTEALNGFSSPKATAAAVGPGTGNPKAKRRRVQRDKSLSA
ncbi:MAG: PAS domain-containing sensor histidine kinase [Acidimicrobiia bacterium]